MSHNPHQCYPHNNPSIPAAATAAAALQRSSQILESIFIPGPSFILGDWDHFWRQTLMRARPQVVHDRELAGEGYKDKIVFSALVWVQFSSTAITVKHRDEYKINQTVAFSFFTFPDAGPTTNIWLIKNHIHAHKQARSPPPSPTQVHAPIRKFKSPIQPLKYLELNWTGSWATKDNKQRSFNRIS